MFDLGGDETKVQHDSSSDDDDDDDGGGGGGGPWSFDDMEQDEGRDAEVSAERAPVRCVIGRGQTQHIGCSRSFVLPARLSFTYRTYTR